MSRIFLITFAVAALVIGLFVWRGFDVTKGNHLVPTGKIGKVRVQKIEDGVAVAVLDFKIRNDSDRPMVVRTAQAKVETADGSLIEGQNASASDATKFFQAYPLLGEQYNPALRDRDVIAPHEELDRMVIARFDIPWEQMEKRKGIRFAVEDVTGPTLNLQVKNQ